ncbi:MAG TPA: metallophosphoesterase [Candidatus Eisenbacteria bacterium]
MGSCFFVSDLHGDETRYRKLLAAIRAERPRGVFLGGDLLPTAGFYAAPGGPSLDFVSGFLVPSFLGLARDLGPDRPEVFLIFGNDDPRSEEGAVRAAAEEGAWHYVHWECHAFGRHQVLGYSFVPPTPFLNKDWERYDVSRYVDPGCVPPEEGFHTAPVSDQEASRSTIGDDLDVLMHDRDLTNAILLFHAPPYRTPLDLMEGEGRTVDHASADPHVGSIAVLRFLEDRQPLLSLHGHIHEAARVSGAWRCRIGRTHALGGAHDGPELALVRFDPDAPEEATRVLI